MKIQIVNIDPHDDYGSIRDKLLWSKAKRALLVWPGRGEILNKRLDLVLLKRLGQRHGITIGLLTFDPGVRANAKELSIPLFEDLENLPENIWAVWETEAEITGRDHPQRELTRPEKPSTGIKSPKHPALRLLILLLPISVFLLALIFLVPSAEILVYPAMLREIETLKFTLSAQPSSSTLDLGYALRELVIEGERRITTSGRISLPDQYARGRVQFTNLTDAPINIPAGTSVRSSSFEGPYFRTDRVVQLEEGEGAQILANVTAASAGPQGNLPAESIDTVDGSLGISVSVSNPEAFSGGSSEIRSAVNRRDTQQLQDELEQELQEQFFVDLSAQLPPELRYLESSYQIVEVLNAEYDAEVGDVADSLQLVLSLKASVAVINFNEAQRHAAMYLDSDLPTDYQFAPGSPRAMTLNDEHFQEDDDSYVEIVFEVVTNREIDQEKIKSSVRGLSLGEAMDQLFNYSGKLSPEIRLSPPWWPRVPFFDHQINVIAVWEDTE
jgi:hypothetical protein